jgi:hypothetical protein
MALMPLTTTGYCLLSPPRPSQAPIKGELVDVSYAALQAHGIVNVALHQEHCLGILFIFSQGRKDLYHV